jgi:hypothetical protein
MTELLLSEQSINTTFTTPQTLLYILIVWLLFFLYLCWNLTSEGGRHWLDEIGEEDHRTFADLVQDAARYCMAVLGSHAIGEIRYPSVFFVIMLQLEVFGNKDEDGE